MIPPLDNGVETLTNTGSNDMMTTTLLLLILTTVIGIWIGLATGFLTKEPVEYSKQDRLYWACLCGMFPAMIGITNGNDGFIVLGIAIALIAYAKPWYRIRRTIR